MKAAAVAVIVTTARIVSFHKLYTHKKANNADTHSQSHVNPDTLK